LAYDRLIVALGSRVDQCLPGASDHALSLQDGTMAARVFERLCTLPPRAKVVVVGGGLTGIETVTEVAETFPELSCAIVTPRLGPGLGNRGRDYLQQEFDRRRIEVVPGRVERVESDRLVLTNGEVPFELCLWSPGFLASPLGSQAGLDADARGRILVDATLRSIGDPAVFVAGDCAVPTVDVGAPILMSCRLAMPMGIHAGRSVAADLAGRAPEPLRLRDSGRCISLGRRAALVQVHDIEGQPCEWIVKGRPAAWIKEAICRWTMRMIRYTGRRTRRDAGPPVARDQPRALPV
jgi:NADH dehydrogenase